MYCYFRVWEYCYFLGKLYYKLKYPRIWLRVLKNHPVHDRKYNEDIIDMSTVDPDTTIPITGILQGFQVTSRMRKAEIDKPHFSNLLSLLGMC